MSNYIYSTFYDIYNKNINNMYKINTLEIILNLVNINNYDYEFNNIFYKYIINFRSKNSYSLYYGLYIFDNIESFYSLLRHCTDTNLFDELTNFLLEIKNKYVLNKL